MPNPSRLDQLRSEYADTYLDEAAFFGDNHAGLVLFEEIAKTSPDRRMQDVHTHADQIGLANNRQFENPTDLLIQGDHYVYSLLRQMRGANGGRRFSEAEILSGDPKARWERFAYALARAGENPVKWWTQHALKHVMDVGTIITPDTAGKVWDELSEKLALPEYFQRELLLKQNVGLVATTDDPADSLEYHQQLKESGYEVDVVPTFRPDALVNKMKIGGDEFNEYLGKLGDAAGVQINDLGDLQQALSLRHDFFAEMGCCSTDHGPDSVPTSGYGDHDAAKRILAAAKEGKQIEPGDIELFTGWLLGETARLNAKKGWVLQLHAGANRNVNHALHAEHGLDVGGDSSQIVGLEGHRALLNYVESQGFGDQGLKVAVYPLNPANHDEIACMAKNFGALVCIGASWWHIDTEHGMREQQQRDKGIMALHEMLYFVTDTRAALSQLSRDALFGMVSSNEAGLAVQRGTMDVDAAVDQVRAITRENPGRFFGLNQ